MTRHACGCFAHAVMTAAIVPLCPALAEASVVVLNRQYQLTGTWATGDSSGEFASNGSGELSNSLLYDNFSVGDIDITRAMRPTLQDYPNSISPFATPYMRLAGEVHPPGVLPANDLDIRLSTVLQGEFLFKVTSPTEARSLSRIDSWGAAFGWASRLETGLYRTHENAPEETIYVFDTGEVSVESRREWLIHALVVQPGDYSLRFTVSMSAIREGIPQNPQYLFSTYVRTASTIQLKFIPSPASLPVFAMVGLYGIQMRRR